VAALRDDNWRIITANKTAGTLKAQTKTFAGVSYTEPLAISIRQVQQDVQMTLGFSLRPGQYAAESYVNRIFCDIFDVAQRSAHSILPPQRSAPRRTSTRNKSPQSNADAPGSPESRVKRSDNHPNQVAPPAPVDEEIRNRY
jgi:hypothetical protein